VILKRKASLEISGGHYRHRMIAENSIQHMRLKSEFPVLSFRIPESISSTAEFRHLHAFHLRHFTHNSSIDQSSPFFHIVLFTKQSVLCLLVRVSLDIRTDEFMGEAMIIV
jgi:hypothetical protein